jgi:micrococcal nuclease
MRVLAPFLIALAALVAGCASDSSDTASEPEATEAPSGAAPAEIVRVVDGDTVIVRGRDGETTVRLLGIDTPESVKPDAPVECFGPEAAERTEALLPRGAAVRVAGDPTQDAVDDFGRRLAYVYPEGAATSVNELLVRDGFARVFISRGTPSLLEPRLTTLERRAREDGRGMWSACAPSGEVSAGVSPVDRNCPDAQRVKGNLPSRVYHRPGDPDYPNVNPERCFTNAASAEAEGFRPVRRR